MLTAFLAWKVFKRTKIVELAEIPLNEALARAAGDMEIEKDKTPLWQKMVGFLWD